MVAARSWQRTAYGAPAPIPPDRRKRPAARLGNLLAAPSGRFTLGLASVQGLLGERRGHASCATVVGGCACQRVERAWGGRVGGAGDRRKYHGRSGGPTR